MKREVVDYIQDMLDAIDDIEAFTKDLLESRQTGCPLNKGGDLKSP